MLFIVLLQALSILASYLTSSAVAPLAREFIEIESPLWYVLTSYIGFDSESLRQCRFEQYLYLL
jgi:hypothetical protein